MKIGVNNLSKRYGKLEVFKGFSLAFPNNKITCLLGPSGAGKTTLLNILSGLIPADEGQLTGMNDLIVSYLFQEPRLLPWKTVRDNFEFVLSQPFPDRKQRSSAIDHYLKVVGLLDFAHYYPAQLSGGMKQRVAIARAFAYPSHLLLMDEPFKGLDMQLKFSLMKEFLRFWQNDQRTVVCVTHDLEEALYLADQICIISNLPASVMRLVTIDLPRAERRQHDHIFQLKKELLSLLTDETP